MIHGEGTVFELVRCESNEAWLEERRKGVGGSDVAAIMGLSAYSTPYQVWLSKTLGVDEDISGKPAVQWGNILEPVIGEHYASEHPDRTVRRVNAIARSIARPWAQASIDYEVRDPELGWGVLEIKTAGLRREGDWAGGVPVYYQTQVAHYLSVTGRPFADVAVLIGGQDYREYRIIRDEEDVSAVDKAVDDFWHDNVEAGIQPAVDAPDSGAIFATHGEASGDFIESETIPSVLSRYLSAKSDRDRANETLKHYEAQLKSVIGDAPGIVCPDGRLTWRRFERSSFDAKGFDRDHPGERDAYITSKQVDGGLVWRPRKEEG